MATYTATNSAITAFPVNYGRSGYNSKPDGEEEPPKDKGRSGYNKGSNDDDEDQGSSK